NELRKRAAWKEGEKKMPQYWVEEGGEMDDTHSTFPELEVTAENLKNNFVDFILDERGRELFGEYIRWEDLVRCEKLVEYVVKNNPDAAPNIRDYHKLRPIPQTYIDALSPKGTNEEEQNPGYF
ncbi:MAG: RagB/SusD family nutrient uptake outer membrane protein, partial [Tannerella sp.]|nr:RagB/SusD family nutrient uptake outer membrane protein [Tannerella sp.]